MAGEYDQSPRKGEYVSHTDQDSALSGYLFKKTREGRWQKRWFETNGVYLTYYKSRKMEKLLAALSLLQVGEIKRLKSEEDPDKLPGLFCIELNTRMYILRAQSEEEADHWVTTLLKIKMEGIASSNNLSSTNKEELSVAFSDTSSVRSISTTDNKSAQNNSDLVNSVQQHQNATAEWKKNEKVNPQGGSFFGICC